MAGAGAVLLAAAVLGTVELRRYVAEDPGFCALCHKASPEFSLWNEGQHHDIACQRCHHSTTEEGVAILRSFLLASPRSRPAAHARPEVGACTSCHLSHDTNWPQVGASRGHRIHAIEKKISCVRCHGTSVHRFEPVVASCRECHGQHAVNLAGMQQIHCFACHNFLSAGGDLTPTRKDCLRCHRSEGVLPTRFASDSPMLFACAACHLPHASTENEQVPCESCHEAMPRAGLHALPHHQRCAACHRPHLWRSERDDCLRCHPRAASHYGDRGCEDCHKWRLPADAKRAARAAGGGSADASGRSSPTSGGSAPPSNPTPSH